MGVLIWETNRYASQQSTHIDDPRWRGRLARNNGGPRWKDTSLLEFHAFFGIVILMELKLTPSVRDYWKRDSFRHCNVIPTVMTRNRFEDLLRCMHCVDNEGICHDKSSPAYDKLVKVRCVLEHFV
jgi:hypothetical protein